MLGWPLSAWKNLGEILALAFGGYWTYMLFVKGRGRFPRASLTHKIDDRSLPDGKRLLRVSTVISNSGTVVLRIREGIFRVQRVLPLPSLIMKAIQGGNDPVGPGKLEVSWPRLVSRRREWLKGEFEIEPGETDVVTCEFVIGGSLQTVRIYSYFRNAKKRWREIGWSLITLYDFGRATPIPFEGTVEDLAGKEREDMKEEERQQKPEPETQQQEEPETPQEQEPETHQQPAPEPFQQQGPEPEPEPDES